MKVLSLLVRLAIPLDYVVVSLGGLEICNDWLVVFAICNCKSEAIATYLCDCARLTEKLH